jgi:hypothetical protein
MPRPFDPEFQFQFSAKLVVVDRNSPPGGNEIFAHFRLSRKTGAEFRAIPGLSELANDLWCFASNLPV